MPKLFKIPSVAISAALFLGAVLTGAASENYRVETQGPEYSLDSWNDAYYYRSMVTDLWSAPISIYERTEAVPLPDDVLEQRNAYYDPSSIHSAYIHVENGTAHQPPYAYRIFLPMAVAAIRQAGISIDHGFLIMYCLGLGLLAAFSYMTVATNSQHGPRSSGSVSWAGVALSGGLVLATAATTNPSLPDALFLGLAMLAVWAANCGRGMTFIVAAAFAALTRETGVILGFYWLISAWGQHPPAGETGTRPYRSDFKVLLPILTTLGVFLASRLVIGVPNNRTDFVQLAEGIASVRTLTIAVGSLAIVCLFSPTLVGFRSYASRRDRVILVGAASYALLTMVIATNTSRMALLVAPLVIGTRSWCVVAESRFWTLGVASAPVAYLLCEQMPAFSRMPGQWLWLTAAGSVLLLQAFAAKRSKSCRYKVR